MAIEGKVKTLYSDKAKSEALFPRTKVNAVSDSNNNSLEAILNKVTYSSQIDNEEILSAPINADSLVGIPGENYATQAFVSNKIMEAQIGGGDSSDIDLSGLATKDDIAVLNTTIQNIDFPVDSVNGKTGNVTLSAADVGARPDNWTPTAADVGALPIGGGTLTGALNAGDNLRLWTDNEGGNIRVYPPSSNTHTDYWEMDSYNGGELRFYASKKSTNTNGSGLVFPLRMLTDGSISVGNVAKTRENLGVAPAVADTTYPNCYYRTVNGVKQWINPPMIVDTEYCTTECRRGKPVYTKLIEFGTFPNATTKSKPIGIAGTKICYAEASTFSNATGEYQPLNMGYNGVLGAYYWVDNAGNLTVRTTSNLTDYYGVFEFKYIKD